MKQNPVTDFPQLRRAIRACRHRPARFDTDMKPMRRAASQLDVGTALDQGSAAMPRTRTGALEPRYRARLRQRRPPGQRLPDMASAIDAGSTLRQHCARLKINTTDRTPVRQGERLVMPVAGRDFEDPAARRPEGYNSCPLFESRQLTITITVSRAIVGRAAGDSARAGSSGEKAHTRRPRGRM